MQINVDSDVYERFHALKKTYSHVETTESEFLSRLMSYVEAHGFGDLRFA